MTPNLTANTSATSGLVDPSATASVGSSSGTHGTNINFGSIGQAGQSLLNGGNVYSLLFIFAVSFVLGLIFIQKK